jgi:glucose/arabinose dehydrogenase/PKD repeat protein
MTLSHGARPALLLMAALLAAAVAGAAPRAGAVPPGFTDTLVASVDSPTALAFAPDGRLLVATQFGALRLVSDGVLAAQPVLDLASVLCTADEEGLLGVALDPAFAANGFLYLYYTRQRSGGCVNRVSRFTMSGPTAAPETELVLIDEIPATGNHNGGDLHFGRDGFLYVSVGDGGCDYAGDSGCAGRNDASRDEHVLLGKILRITSAGDVPASNPFQGPGTARCNVTGSTSPGSKCQETYAWGLRNPFRLAFDPNAASTRFYVNDVGEGAWEEVNEGIAGADYGWNDREGPCVNGSQTDCGPPPAGMTNPVYAYSHGESPCHAITGGAFVPAGVWPSAYEGAYLYGDYTCGKIFSIVPNGGGFTRTELADDVGAVVNLVFGPSPGGGALYYTNYTNGGEVRRLEPVAADNRAPTARLTATPTSGPLPLAVELDGSASTDPDAGDALTYVWDFGDGSPPLTTTEPITRHTYSVAGTFTALLVVRDDDGASSPSAAVRIDPGNTAPSLSIDSPGAEQLFAVGDAITLHATAVDAEDGPLGPSSLTWRVLRHHDTHTHPFLAPTVGNDLVVFQPAPEDLGSGIDGYLEVFVTARDAQGVSTTVTREIHPRRVGLTFATEPSGLEILVAGTAHTTPATLRSWAGHVLGLDARTQSNDDGTWGFSSWSDGGAASHQIVTPSAPTTYTASFTRLAESGLVAAFGFGEDAGGLVGDASGRGNDGLVSGAQWTPAGRFGSGLVFDGVNDWITVADDDSLDASTGLTVEAWVRPSRLGQWRTVVVKERAGGVAYSLYADQAGGRPVGQVFLAGERDALGSAPLASNEWSHLALTFDGGIARLYVDGLQVGSVGAAGALSPSAGPLRIGGNGVWGEWFQGAIDEVRVYDRALSAAEVQRDMHTPVDALPPTPSDTTAPTAPTGLSVTTAIGVASLTWGESADDVGVARYSVHRSTTSGFEPAAGNRVGQPTGTSFVDSGLADGTYFYRVLAEDAAGNASLPSGEVAAVVPADAPPEVTLTAPSAGAVVTGTTVVAATARDDGAVAGVQFRLGTVVLGAEDTTPPYSIAWDTTTVANGVYVLGAVARDSAGQTATAAPVTVTVDNPPPAPPPDGLVAAYGFDAGSGPVVADASGHGNTGTIAGASWAQAGRFGAALDFDGLNDWVTVADGPSLDLTSGATIEAWVRPSARGGWRTVAVKESSSGIVYSLYADQAAGQRPVGQVFIGGEHNAFGTSPVELNVWTHLATTFDGTVVRLYVNGVEAGLALAPGAMTPSAGPLRIGGNGIWSEWFSGLIDEVRVYARPLSAAEIQRDMSAPVDGPAPPADTTPPGPPTELFASVSQRSVSLGWTPATDDVGVLRYNVHRSQTAGFVPTAENRVAQTSGAGFVDADLEPGT